jgi:hypothetical protein
VAKHSITQSGEFAELIARFRDNGLTNISQPGIFQRLWESIVLQPNIAGVGVDVKKFLDGK